MRSPLCLTLAALSLGLAAPGPSAAVDQAAPTREAWQTVCYYVYEPMWTADRGWHLVYAKRCINHLAFAPETGRRADPA